MEGKDARVLEDDATQVCPRCAETVKAAAKVCRFCGHEFDPAPPLVSAPPPPPPFPGPRPGN